MSRPAGIYIHIPFCARKCPYCDFYSVTDPGEAGRYFEALEREAELYAQRFRPAATLYVGGGTPSLAAPERIGALPGMARRLFGLRQGAEITLEVNPDDVTPAALAIWRGAGFGRISIGVQSLDDGELRALGRRHDARAAERAVLAARAAGFGSVGIDLIFGLAGQSASGWRRTLERAADLAPEHISCYQLTVAPGTPFGARAAAGGAVAAGEQAQREMFLAAARLLTARGYLHYEVSNFARGSEYRSRHNMGYWRHAPYLGLGPSAHSFDGQRRWWNARSLGGWLAALEAGRPPLEGEERLSQEQLLTERLMLGLRTSDGVPLELIERFEGAQAALAQLEAGGLVRVAGGRAAPTREGFLVADRLPLLFLG